MQERVPENKCILDPSQRQTECLAEQMTCPMHVYSGHTSSHALTQLIAHMHNVHTLRTQCTCGLQCTCGSKCDVSTFRSSKDMPKLYLTNCRMSCTVAPSCERAASTSTCCCSSWLPVIATQQRGAAVDLTLQQHDSRTQEYAVTCQKLFESRCAGGLLWTYIKVEIASAAFFGRQHIVCNGLLIHEVWHGGLY